MTNSGDANIYNIPNYQKDVSNFVKFVKSYLNNFQNFLRFVKDLQVFWHLKKLNNYRSSNQLNFEKILIDGHFNNLGYFFRLQIFRAAIKDSNSTELAIYWKYQPLILSIILRFFEIDRRKRIYTSPTRNSILEAAELIRNVRQPSDLLKIKLPEGVPASFLYDYILKIQRSGTVNTSDPKICFYLAEFIECIKQVKNVLEKFDPDLVVLSHTIGAFCSPLAWIASSKGIKVVYLWGKYGMPKFTKIGRPADLFKSQDRPLYSDFQHLQEGELLKLRMDGSKYLKDRAEGKTEDLGSKFAIKEAGPISTKIQFDGRPVIAVYTSNWFDFPHMFGMSNFSDFYDWIDETLKLAIKLDNFIWVFKSHPVDRWYNSSGLAMHFKEPQQSHIYFVDSNTSSTEILKISNAVVTYHGSIGIEATARKIPVLLADRGWYHDWNFCKLANTKSEYKRILNSNWFEKLNVNKNASLAETFAGAYFCHLDWQLSGILPDDSNRADLRKAIINIIQNEEAYILRELRSITDWCQAPCAGFHSHKILNSHHEKNYFS